jgi:acetyl-CoA C-acetyltransferase
MNNDVVIVSAARTPIGSFGGAFATLSAVDLGNVAAQAAIARAGVDASKIDELIFGNVLCAGLGQNVARQVALASGMREESTAFNVSKVCGSGLKSVILAAQAILTNDADVVLAGGTESMSNAAYVLPTTRWGQRMGNGTTVDTMICDGLTDAFDHQHMGITAENIASQFGISRAELDQFSATSQQRAEKAQKENRFAEEIVPVNVRQRKETVAVTSDEFPRHGTTEASLAKLKPAFKPDGVVTAGNASGINDGAAALVLMSRTAAEQLGLRPLARIVSWGAAGVSPKIMGYGPVPATQRALQRAGLSVNDLDLVEANEAFAAQSIAVVRGLELDPEIVNVNGGAIALGHPVGASGARILVTLLHEMQKRESRRGLATLCVGGGMGVSLIVESEPR